MGRRIARSANPPCALVGDLRFRLQFPVGSARSVPSPAHRGTMIGQRVRKELLDAALATQPIEPVVTAPDGPTSFRAIEGERD